MRSIEAVKNAFSMFLLLKRKTVDDKTTYVAVPALYVPTGIGS